VIQALQSRLALANVKIEHGWENLSLDAIEPRVEAELKRKRCRLCNETLSNTSSSVFNRFYPIKKQDSSSLTAPMYSDSVGGCSKRAKHQRPIRHPALGSRARTKARTPTTRAPFWKSNYRLPESSAVYHNWHAHFSVSHVPSLSVISETSTIPDDPASPLFADDDDADLPLHSFHVDTPHIPFFLSRTASTPSLHLAHSAQSRKKTLNTTSTNAQTGEDGADLLILLAASPSPASSGIKARMFPPSTLPLKATTLPSSMMSTFDDAGLLGFGPTTPGMPFNFADFVNVTPNPSQAAWTTTPGIAKTSVPKGCSR
ncbi:hypothetical protein LTR04_005632, partial [Oleoguttula sp. CCFEE 6159]